MIFIFYFVKVVELETNRKLLFHLHFFIRTILWKNTRLIFAQNLKANNPSLGKRNKVSSFQFTNKYLQLIKCFKSNKFSKLRFASCLQYITRHRCVSTYKNFIQLLISRPGTIVLLIKYYEQIKKNWGWKSLKSSEQPASTQNLLVRSKK